MNSSPRYRSSGACAALVAIAILPAAAQEPPDTLFPLDAIVVTATKLPTPRSAVPASVTVLSGADLREAGVRFVADALRTVPGLAIVRSGSIGGLTSVFVRGAESDHVQVLIDGVPLNDPGGSVDLAHLMTADVERIEIVRGPASVLYGTDAAAGVIQIFTRRGDGPARLETAVSALTTKHEGTAGDRAGGYDVATSLHGGGPRTQWGLTAARSGFDGVLARNNEYANTTGSAGIRYGLAAATAVRLDLRFGHGTFHYPTDDAGEPVDGNQYRRSRTLAGLLEVEHAFSPGFELRGSITSHTADHLVDDAPDEPGDTLGFYALRSSDRFRRQRVDVHANVRSGHTILTAGAAAERQRGENDLASSSSFGPYGDSSANERGNHAGYLQLVTAARSGLTITAGTRLERSSRFGSLTSWRVGFNLGRPHGTIRLAAGTGFREPTFYENFATGFVRGNPELAPERTRSAEVGVERRWAGGRVRVEATAFLQQLRNLIQYTAAPPANASNYHNVGEARAAGLELAAAADPAAPFGLDLSLTLLHTRVTDAGFGEDQAFLEERPLLRRPGLRAGLAASWHPGPGRLDLRLVVVGKREDLDFADPAAFAGARVTLPAHALLGLSFARTLSQQADGRRVELSLRADNLLDARYEEIRNFPAPRRTLAIGLRAVTGF